ncbi:MAG: hypothetical protein M1830_006452, partial [Pleopsidium flavum]
MSTDAALPSEFDKNGNHDNLRFPPFHEEMLTQNWWSAGESVGRVKVVIAEGFAKENHKSPFERVKNIISFSFQHAPLDVLESSGIAWPNPGMWYQPSQPFYNASSLSPRKTRKEGPDAHGHTPRRRDSYARSFGDVNTAPVPIPSHIYKSMPPPAVPGRGPLLKDPYWSAPPSMPDPFLDNSQGPSYESFAGRSGSEDLSMPDYSHSITPASSRNISGSNNMHRKPPSVTEPIGDDQYDMLINVISPRKDGMSGTFAPANTRRSSTVSTPNIVTRPSAAAEARAASYAQGHSRTVSFREPGPSTNRQTSDISMKSRYSEGAVESEGITEVNIHSKPAGSVKGKKEGRGSDLGAKQREISTDPIGRSKKENAKGTGGSPSTLSESKRKRTLTVSETKIMVKDGDVQSSPTRKVSRRESHGAQPVITIDDLTDEDVE